MAHDGIMVNSYLEAGKTPCPYRQAAPMSDGPRVNSESSLSLGWVGILWAWCAAFCLWRVASLLLEKVPLLGNQYIQ